MNILVVGNGFDLAHGLPTRYTDFLMFLETIEEIKSHRDMSDLISVYTGRGLVTLDKGKYYYELNSYVKNYLYGPIKVNTVENISELIQQNIWYSFFKRRYSDSNALGNNWIDFEGEIRRIIEYYDHQINDIYTPLERPKADCPEEVYIFGQVVESIAAYKEIRTYSDFINVTHDDLLKLIRCLEIYLDDCIKNIPIGSYSPDIHNIHLDAVLSFNYTSTIKRVTEYTTLNDDMIHYIHGYCDSSRNITDNNMVLGINEYWDNKEKDMNTNFNIYKKFVQRIMKKTGVAYKKWVADHNYKREFKGLLEPLNIYIFGHSLDVTDKDILNELITNKDAITYVFYRNSQQQAQQIANLSKILGQDKLLEYVFSAEPKIIFKQQQPMQPISKT